MGRDKALLVVDGRPMARRVADAATEAGAASVVAVGGDAAALRAIGLDPRTDDRPGEGPLPAVAAALAASDRDLVLLLACDLVAPSPVAMAAVVQALDADPTADLAVPVDGAGHPQWLHAAWRTRTAPALSAAVAAGTRSLAVVAARLSVREVRGLDPSAMRDADRPEDLPGAG